jgi:hypothetical protein
MKEERIAEALRLMTSKLICLFASAGLLTFSPISYSSENVSQQNNQRSIAKIETSAGSFYMIKDYIDKYINETDFKLYKIVSLRAKDHLLEELQKNDKSLNNKTIVLRGFKKDKCWWIKSRYFCDFLVPVNGVSFKSKTPSKSLKAYLKTLDLLDSVSVVDFNDKRYVVSLASGEAINLPPKDKLNLMKSTKLLAKSGLIKFSNGENILFDSSYTERATTITASEVRLNTITILNELIQSKSSGIVKGFNYIRYTLDGLMFNYAYIEIPKN